MPAMFDPSEVKKLFQPEKNSNGEDNGQVVIIGGSKLFHGAPVLAATVASKIVDMVFFASPEQSLGDLAKDMKSRLSSFIWVPWEDIDHYVEKADAILIGPGFMRFESEKIAPGVRHMECDEACQISREATKRLLRAFPSKKWVVDAGSLQTMEVSWLPEGSIVTPNKKEFELLFGGELSPEQAAQKYKCIVVLKGPITVVASPDKTIEVHGGNPGLTKGGTGDVQAGLTVSLLAKNEPFLSASTAAYIIKAAADKLHERVGTYFNADDLSKEIPNLLFELQK
jgi:NAD(P)H-hydrate epimerase